MRSATAIPSEVERSLAKLRSALFDTQLSLQERRYRLKESTGELVGWELNALPLLREALMSSEPEVVAMAVEAPGRMGTLPRELHPELMHVLRTTESAELAGLTGNRLIGGPWQAEELDDLVRLLRERPVVRETLIWLIPSVAASNPASQEQSRKTVEGLLEDDQPEVRTVAAKILKEFPEPAPAQTDLVAQVMAKLRAADAGQCLEGLRQAQALGEYTPELEALIQDFARQHDRPELRLAAGQALRRRQAQGGGAPDLVDESANTLPKTAYGTASIPELVAALADGPEAVKSATAALATVPQAYWETHSPEKLAVLPMLYALFQDPDPERVEAAAVALPALQPGSPKLLYTFQELKPLFHVMEESLSPGEFAIAMRDFQSSAELFWKARFGNSPPTHVLAFFVQGLPVGPMHENRPAYEAMVKAMKKLDPWLKPPVPEN